MQLRAHITEVLIDQIPSLAALLRFLEQLAVTAPPAYKMDLLIEQISQVYENMVAKYRGQWRAIAAAQMDELLNQSDKETKELAASVLSQANKQR